MQKILDAIEQHGMLLEADSVLPSVAGLVADEAIRGSWWGHRAGKAIYNICEALIERDDILRVKLLQGKLTYVHRRLWPELTAVALAKAPWQMQALSPAAMALLALVENVGMVRTDATPAALNAKDARQAAKELEDRLLVLGQSIHSASGAHVKAIESWRNWIGRTGFESATRSVDAACAVLEAVAVKLGSRPTKRALPWPRVS